MIFKETLPLSSLHNALKGVFGFVGDTCLSFPLPNCIPINYNQECNFARFVFLGVSFFFFSFFLCLIWWKKSSKMLLYMMCDNSFRLLVVFCEIASYPILIRSRHKICCIYQVWSQQWQCGHESTHGFCTAQSFLVCLFPLVFSLFIFCSFSSKPWLFHIGVEEIGERFKGVDNACWHGFSYHCMAF